MTSVTSGYEPAAAAVESGPIILLIDALDECDSEDQIAPLLRILINTDSTRLKIFTTSRPDMPVRLGFGNISGGYDDIILHELPRPIIERDIALYFRHELKIVLKEYNMSIPDHAAAMLPKDWPGEANLDRLTSMAIPLFIFASTLCRLLSDARLGSPEQQLQDILSYQLVEKHSQLDSTYMPVLDRLVKGLSAINVDRVWSNFRQIHILSQISFSSDSSLISSADVGIETWKSDRGRRIWALRNKDNAVEPIAFANNQSILAVVDTWNSKIRILCMESGKCMETINNNSVGDGDEGGESSYRITALAFSHDDV